MNYTSKIMSVFRSTENFLLPIFLGFSKVSSMLHHGPVGRVHSKECYFIFTYTFLAFFFVLHQKKCVFIIFISFAGDVSDLRNRILTNQKPEWMRRNCQWNSMFWQNCCQKLSDVGHKEDEIMLAENVLFLYTKAASFTSNIDKYIRFTLSAVTCSTDDFNMKTKVALL